MPNPKIKMLPLPTNEACTKSFTTKIKSESRQTLQNSNNEHIGINSICYYDSTCSNN